MGERARAAVLAAIGALVGAPAAEAAAKQSPAKGNGVKDGTLTLKDFKRGVLESKFYTEREVRQLLHKLEGALSYKIGQVTAASAPVVVESKVDTSPFARTADMTAGLTDLSLKIDSLAKVLDQKFLKQEAVDVVQDARLAAGDAVDAQQAQKVLKLEAAVQRFGDGSVRTGRVRQVATEAAPDLLVIDGAVSARPVGPADDRRLALRLTDLSGQDATLVGTRNGDPVGPVALGAGASQELAVISEGATQFVLQVLSADGGLATLTVSVFGDGSVRTWAGQALAAG